MSLFCRYSSLRILAQAEGCVYFPLMMALWVFPELARNGNFYVGQHVAVVLLLIKTVKYLTRGILISIRTLYVFGDGTWIYRKTVEAGLIDRFCSCCDRLSRSAIILYQNHFLKKWSFVKSRNGWKNI
jgi:hypothetical protein